MFEYSLTSLETGSADPQEDEMSINEQSAAAPVIIAGAGPTGLTLATELRRGGADVVLLERRSAFAGI